MIERNQRKSLIFALLCVLLWATVASAFKLLLVKVDFKTALLPINIFSFLFFFSLCVKTNSIKDLINFDKKNILKSVIMGFLNPFLYYNLLFYGYSNLSGQVALVTNYSWSIFLVVISALLGFNKLSLVNVFVLVIGFLGVAVIGYNPNQEVKFDIIPFIGLLFSAIIWALYWLFSAKDERKSEVKLASYFFFGGIYHLLYWVANLFQNEQTVDFVVSLEYVLLVIYIALFEMGLTFYLWEKAVSYSENITLTTNLIFITPFLSVLILSQVTGEIIQFSTIIGLLLIVISIILQRFTKTNMKN